MASRTPPATQAWLAKTSGIDRSLISRLLKGERPPTLDALQYLAPVFGLSVDELVAGTSAERRLQETVAVVPHEDYEAAVRQLIANETRVREVEAQLRFATETIAQLRGQNEQLRGQKDVAVSETQRISGEKQQVERELAATRETIRRQEQDLRRHVASLSRAAGELAALKEKFQELSKELASTQQSSRTTMLLAGIAAITGMAGLAHIFDKKEA